MTVQMTNRGSLLMWVTELPVRSFTRNGSRPMRSRGERLVALAAKAFRLSPEAMTDARRFARQTQARAAVVWALRQNEPVMSFESIAALLGRTDHGTARHLLQRAEDLRAADPDFRAITEYLSAQP